jgi:branched-chain amino acid transport system permease protein
MALFAASLHFIMGLGGMVSFGHAAYFGLGAYGAALAMKFLGAGMIVGLFAGPLLAAAGALVFGWFCVRLSGVYLAMLTLAAAQIVWSIGLQWGSATGGDDGILGVRPLPLFASKTGFLYLTLALCGGAILLLRRMAHAPFGYVLRGGRDSPLRTEAIGIDLMRHQWYAFIASGFFAGIAGAIFVYSKGSVFPTELSIPRSVDGLVMVLLGGIQSLSGPIVGAVSFNLLTDLISRLAFWRAILGITIVALVVLAPEGLAGFGRRISRIWGSR